MRRKEREITDPEKIRSIILSCGCCRLGLADGDSAYIVPLNFGYEEQQGRSFFYFHGAPEGRKLDLIRRNRRAGFELDCGHELVPGSSACQYTMKYQSVIGTGKVFFLSDPDQKRRALSVIMEHYSPGQEWNFPDEALRHVCVFCLEVETISCKEHR
ncbi:MAG: pyridoxamine 5'-phosphate oxidase family protein [Eubacteriales bacterium]|nr:pyridoxamine 5'-phosphate oxidase family protein [Eubacteriales bacterium]